MEEPIQILESNPIDRGTKKLLIVAYLIYILLWGSLCMVGTVYLILQYDWSKWWMLFAIILCGISYKPHTWYSLLDGIERKGKDDDE